MELLQRFGRTAKPGEVLFREGDEGRQMFVLQTGKVRLTRSICGKDKIIADLGPGEFFGEMAILNQKPRSASATILEESKLLSIDSKTFEAMIKANTEIAVRMLQSFSARLDEANRQIETLLVRDANSRVVASLLHQVDTKGVHVPQGIQVVFDQEEMVTQTGIDREKIDAVFNRLAHLQLIVRMSDGILVRDYSKLLEFQAFIRERMEEGNIFLKDA